MATKRWHPDRPWPTAPQEARRVARLVALVAFVEFALNSMQSFLSHSNVMGSAWLFGGCAVFLVNVRIESYFGKQRRMAP